MAVTKAEKILITLLKESNLGINNILGVMLLLQKEEALIEDMIVWIYDNHPTEDEILEKMAEIFSEDLLMG